MSAIRFDDRVLAGLLLLGLALSGAQPLLAQDYPTRTVRIVTSEAGGGSDLAARVLAQTLSASYGQPVVVENRGGGVIAGEVVSKSAPDGYTLLMYGNTLWTLPLIRKDPPPYNVARDFLPITMALQTPVILVVHPSLQVNSTRELIALAKSRPGQLNYGSAAVGTSNHMAAELFRFMAGIDLVRIGYKGAMSALISTVVGETQVQFPVIGLGMAQMKAGKLKGLAVSSAKPSVLAPGVPTIAETLPGYETAFRTALFTPTGTPAALVARIHRDVDQALQRPEVRQKLLGMGMEVIASSPQETAASISAEVSVMGKVIAQAGIRE